jgi:hypothetical protein
MTVKIRSIGFPALASLADSPPAPHLKLGVPATHGPVIDRAAIARFREQLLHGTAVQQPTVLAIDLEGRFPTAAVLFELVVPLAQAARSGQLGPLVLVICTPDELVRNTLRALATAYELALFLAPSPAQLGEAEPAGDLTATERETLDTLQRLGGRVSVATFAKATGLAAPAATNRLVNVMQKGFVHRVERPRHEGVIYLDPRGAAPASRDPAVPQSIARELNIFAAVTGHSAEDLLQVAWSEWLAEHPAETEPTPQTRDEAWSAYRKRHAGELSEGLRWAQSVLTEPKRASVEASGMPDEDLKAIRDAFE